MGLESVTKYYPRIRPDLDKPVWGIVPKNSYATLPYYVPTDDPEAGFDSIQEAQDFLMANLDKVKAKHYANQVLQMFDIIAVTVVAKGKPPSTIKWENV